MLDLTEKPGDDAPGHQKPFRWKLLGTAVAVAWGLVLVNYGPALPETAGAPSYAIYDELTPANRSKMCEPDRPPAELLTWDNKRKLSPEALRYLASLIYSDGDERPPGSCGTDARRRRVKDREIFFPAGVSESDILTVSADFEAGLQGRLRSEQAAFVLTVVAWWAASSAAFAALVWALALVLRSGVERWHPGQLALAWIGVAAMVSVFLSFADNSLANLARGLWLGLLYPDVPMLSVIALLPMLMWMLLAVLSIGTVVGVFVVTWTWLGARTAR